MHKRLGLRESFSWVFIGSIIASGCQWGMLILLTRLLSPAEVGYYSLGLAITAPIIMLSMLQLRVVLITDIQNSSRFENYFGARLMTNVLALLVIIGILVSLRGRYDLDVYLIIFVIGLNKTIESTGDIVYGLMQKHERLDKVAISMILRQVGAFVLLGIVLKITGSLLLAVVSIGLWWLLVLFFFDRTNAQKFGHIVPNFHLKKNLSIIWVGLPLGLVMGLISFNSNVPRYFVEAYMGSDNLGYFAAMAYVVVGLSKIVTALGRSASARLAQYYAFNPLGYIKLLQKIFVIVLILVLGLVLFSIYLGKLFLSIVYTPEYAKRQDVFIWLVIAGGVMMLASVLGYGMSAARRFKSQVPIFCISCCICLLSSWFFVPRYGMKGASWAILLAGITQFFGSLIVVLLSIKHCSVKKESTGKDVLNV